MYRPGAVHSSMTYKRFSAGLKILGLPVISRISVFTICCTGLFWLIMGSHAFCAENPDKLYRQGRYADAERLYSRLVMEHPNDTRYRYNRGCALYRHHKYQAAAIVFSNVLKNSTDDDIRSRAAYNLGNFFYLMMQFHAAAKLYKRAILYDPDNDDARYNLEVILRMLQHLPPEILRSDGSPPRKNSRNSPSTGQKQMTPGSQDEQEGTDSKPQDQDIVDLTGELESIDTMSRLEEDISMEESRATGMDEKKAAAFLDNVKEDRTKFLQSLISDEKKEGIWSRKDW